MKAFVVTFDTDEYKIQAAAFSFTKAFEAAFDVLLYEFLWEYRMKRIAKGKPQLPSLNVQIRAEEMTLKEASKVMDGPITVADLREGGVVNRLVKETIEE